MLGLEAVILEPIFPLMRFVMRLGFVDSPGGAAVDDVEQPAKFEWRMNDISKRPAVRAEF